MRMWHWSLAILLVAALGAPLASARPGKSRSVAGEARRWVVGPQGPALDRIKAMTRIGFGSCAHQDRAQTHWAALRAAKLDLFLFAGDNVYGDVGFDGDARLPYLQSAYAKIAAQPDYLAFRQETPALATWDDHDFGLNDAGGTFAFKQRAEAMFETFWRSSPAVRQHPGVYDAVIAGPIGQRVQIIILDTRFFRSPLVRGPDVVPRPPYGPYLPNTDPGATVLGDAQWRWLDAQLRKPAELRLILSSIQVLADGHQYEKWGNFPADRAKLFAHLKASGARNVILLSGDRHMGALYRENAVLDYPLTELTASALNMTNKLGAGQTEEPGPNRIKGPLREDHFGLVDVDWINHTVRLSLRKLNGDEAMTETIALQ